MKDKFDKILSNKIKKVFENRDVTYNPEHWEMLISKKEKKKRRILFLWRFAGVALLFIIAGSLGKFLFFNSDSIQNKELEIVVDEKKTFKNDTLNDTFITNGGIDSINAKDNIRISEIDSSNSNNRVLQKLKMNDTKIKSNINDIAISSSNTYKNKKLKNSSALANKTTLQKDSLKRNIFNDEVLDLAIENKNITQNDIVIDTIEKSKLLLNTKKQVDIEELIAVHDDEDFNEKPNNKSVKIGVNVSPMINYIQENENSNIGFSSGLTVEIPILKKIDIYAGILYTNQKFDIYQQNNFLRDAVSNGGVQLTSKETAMKGIEIPINVKYNFTISKKNLFVSAGFSSTSYFKEDITADYVVNTKIATPAIDSYGNNIVQYELAQSNKTVKTKQNSTDDFNFASMLNLSFGMEFPINNHRQSIVIEPYFKYSLHPVTLQELDFTNMGFYLRYNFSFKRK